MTLQTAVVVSLIATACVVAWLAWSWCKKPSARKPTRGAVPPRPSPPSPAPDCMASGPLDLKVVQQPAPSPALRKAEKPKKPAAMTAGPAKVAKVKARRRK